MKRIPKENVDLGNKPFESEGTHQPTHLLDEMRKASGDLPDQPPDNPVKDDKPYKNLKKNGS